MIKHDAFILPLSFDKETLDYSTVEIYKEILKDIDSLGTQFHWMFDYSKICFCYLTTPSEAFPVREHAFSEGMGYQCLLDNIHPDDVLFLLDLQKNAFEFIKTKANILDYKIVFKLRILCAGCDYVTHNFQIKLIKLDAKGQMWVSLANGVPAKTDNYFHPIIININDSSEFYRPNIKHVKKEFIDASLTNREKQVLNMLSKHKVAEEICTTLQITESTLKLHKGNLIKKLNAKNCVVALENAGLLGLL